MDKVDRYHQILQKVIEELAEMYSEGNEVAILPVCDPTHGQYLLISLGWQKVGRHEHGIVFHAQLQGTKIRIESDGTEEGIATFLIEAGIEKSDIELAWASPRRTDNSAAIAA